MAERTRTREVDGFCFFNEEKAIKYLKGKVTVRVTKDKAGKSISLQFYNVMIEIPVEPVEDMLDVVEPAQEIEGVEITHVTYEPWQLGREQ